MVRRQEACLHTYTHFSTCTDCPEQGHAGCTRASAYLPMRKHRHIYVFVCVCRMFIHRMFDACTYICEMSIAYVVLCGSWAPSLPVRRGAFSYHACHALYLVPAFLVYSILIARIWWCFRVDLLILQVLAGALPPL